MTPAERWARQNCAAYSTYGSVITVDIAALNELVLEVEDFRGTQIPTPARVCPNCAKVFQIRTPYQKFCSHKCRHEARSNEIKKTKTNKSRRPFQPSR